MSASSRDQPLFRRRLADGGDVIHRVAERDGLERRRRRLDARSVESARAKAPSIARSRSGRSGWPAGVRWSRQAGWVIRSVDMDDPGGRGRSVIAEAFASGLSRRHGRSSQPVTAHSHLCPVTLTPGGGGGSSGTKNVGASGSAASTRYCSKSVTPSAAEEAIVDEEIAGKAACRLLKDEVRRVRHDLRACATCA